MTSRTTRVPLTAARSPAAVVLLLTGCGAAPAECPKAAAPPGPEAATRCAGAGSRLTRRARRGLPRTVGWHLPALP
ncbi:hypothetical protein Slala05_45090 [Streptomyces lavendulae subsp. lavendulae]|nr:hypothetical protein Slala05_45090 [Streptomyces lavendulae subsp. lavendulae]